MSVASKVGALAARLGKNNPGEYMMTGGVAKNQGIIKALEEKIGAPLYICDEAQLCGALGAALFAFEKCRRRPLIAAFSFSYFTSTSSILKFSSFPAISWFASKVIVVSSFAATLTGNGWPY